MSISIGIIGLPNSGKTTVFNALTRGTVSSEDTLLHIGIAKVPEPRLVTLGEMIHPKRLVPAEIHYIDFGATGKGIHGQLLNQLNQSDALIIVIRAFVNESVPHPEGSIDIERDISSMNLELVLSDLMTLTRRLEKIEDSLKGIQVSERQSILQEKNTVQKIKTSLETDHPIREEQLTPLETKLVTQYNLLTAKPLLMVINIGEEQIKEATSLEHKLASKYARPQYQLTTLCGKLEAELIQLDDDTAREMRSEYGLNQMVLERTLKNSYGLLNLVTFFTIVSGEVKAWSIPKGTTALSAAGRIHSDMERGFIRAEVVNFNDLIQYGSLAEARKKGHLRLEGKSTEIQDGDIVTFLFNV